MRRAPSFVLLPALALSGAQYAPAASAPTPAAAPRPNVLVIVTDDQAPMEALRVMPQTRRWFRKRGTRFPRAFVTTPLCCPSRASIFTGRYAHNHGVVDNHNALRLDQTTTVQRALRETGYFTALAGKFLNRWPTERPPPHFDRWASYSPLDLTRPYFDAEFNLDGQVREVRGYTTDFLARRSAAFLRWFDEQNDARPWLLYVTPFAPHGPHQPAPRHKRAPVPKWRPLPSAFEGDRSDKPPFLRARSVKVKTIKRIRKRQMRTLMAVDEMVGRLFRALGRLEERGNTLSFFLSDNGYTWGDHGWIDKRLAYTPSIKVPFLARWPGRLAAGGADPRFVTNVDIAPAILAVAGAPAPEPLDGRSLFAPGGRSRLFFEFHSDVEGPIPTWTSIRTARAQYVEYRDDRTGAVTFREYYDLVDDPHQLENLLADDDPSNDPSPDELAALRVQLARDARCEGTHGPFACP